MKPLPDEVSIIYDQLLIWENANSPEDLYSGLFDKQDTLLMLSRVVGELKNNNPPDLATLPNDWALFVVNIFVEFAFDFGINNIKGIISPPQKNAIADASETVLGQSPSTWPANIFANEYILINNLFDPPVLP